MDNEDALRMPMERFGKLWVILATSGEDLAEVKGCREVDADNGAPNDTRSHDPHFRAHGI